MADDSDKLDPYRSPAIDAIVLEDHERPLTRQERRVLQMYFDHRERPFTRLGLFRRMVPPWTFLAACMAILTAMVYVITPRYSELPSYVMVGVIGAFAGAVLRDCGVVMQLVKMWPVFREVFDWQKIERRLGQ